MSAAVAYSYDARVTIASPTIAIVDDDVAVCTGVQRLLRSAGWTATIFTSGSAFLASLAPLAAAAPDCVILDIVMPGMTGPEVLVRLRAMGLDVPVLFISAEDRLDLTRFGDLLGPIGFLHKPFDGDELLRLISTTLGGPLG
jgi:FixJ family two-component response regulator